MPEKGDAGARPRRTPRPVRYRHASAELVQRSARRLVRGGKASFPSQAAFRTALLTLLRTEEPLAVIGGKRLRRLLIDSPGIRVTVAYTERAGGSLPTSCPVCGSPLFPIKNRTLSGEVVAIGRRCSKCAYWTHRLRRVPVRYGFVQTGIDGRASR